MSKEYIAYWTGEPPILARVWPEDLAEIDDPSKFRDQGWRILILFEDRDGEEAIIRSTWEQTIEDATSHADIRWKNRPVWRDSETGAAVNLPYREFSDDEKIEI